MLKSGLMYWGCEGGQPVDRLSRLHFGNRNPAKPFFAGRVKRWRFFQHNSYDTDLNRNGGTAHDNVQAGKTPTKV